MRRNNLLVAEEGRTLQIPSGSGVPASIAYLHSLVARGLGDYYDYEAGVFKVKILAADVVREPSLRPVEIVQLNYQKEGD